MASRALIIRLRIEIAFCFISPKIYFFLIFFLVRRFSYVNDLTCFFQLSWLNLISLHHYFIHRFLLISSLNSKHLHFSIPSVFFYGFWSLFKKFPIPPYYSLLSATIPLSQRQKRNNFNEFHINLLWIKNKASIGALNAHACVQKFSRTCKSEALRMTEGRRDKNGRNEPG